MFSNFRIEICLRVEIFQRIDQSIGSEKEFEDLAEDLVEILMKHATTSYENQANNMVSQKFRTSTSDACFRNGHDDTIIEWKFDLTVFGFAKHHHDLVSICKSKKICNTVSNFEMFLPSVASVS